MLAHRAARDLLCPVTAFGGVIMQDELKGEMKKAEGKVKEEFGKAAGDRSTEWGGKLDQLKGEAQKKAGEIEEEGRRQEGIDQPASR
jgi:uncharacterized protein YjbJ (UPF0337 family)